MATYQVSGVALPDTTECVIVGDELAALLASAFEGWTSAQNSSGSTFIFSRHDPNGCHGHSVLGSSTLTKTTLASTVAGCDVLIELEETGGWVVAKVQGDGVAVATVDGTLLAASLRAAALVATTPEQVVTTGKAANLMGTASDGTTWFLVAGHQRPVHCTALSTVGAMEAGAVVLVELSTGNWSTVTL